MTLSGTEVRTRAAAETTPPASRRRGLLGGTGSLTHRPGTGLALVLPAVAFVVTFVFVPLVFAVYISMTNWPLIGSYKFVGFANYASIAQDTAFWKSVPSKSIGSEKLFRVPAKYARSCRSASTSTG